MIPRTKNHDGRQVLGRAAGLLTLSLFWLAGIACSTPADEPRELRASRMVAVGSADCGYTVTADVNGVSKKGFNAKVQVTNVSGVPSTVFSVLIDADVAQLVHVAHGSFQAVEGGYLLSPLDSLASSVLDPGQTYTYELKFDGEYTTLAPYILSNNGVNCDQEAPTVSLSVSGTFFSSAGTLTLTADATDNVAVAKVVFSQDGSTIATVAAAPYTFQVPVTAALNGRHRYTATAYDMTGNAASETKRVLMAIGNKFFGTATVDAADYAGLLAHFNQVTPGNAGKWGVVEAVRGQMSFADLDIAYKFAKDNNLPFKLHTLVWGQQQPSWIAGLSAEEQLAAIDAWMAALAARYPDVAMIDVVNEPMHAKPIYADALGGAGATGWDWVVKAFEMARGHFPNAELILNEYYVLPMASFTTDFLKIVKVLNDRGLIDGIGEQGHFYERVELSVLSANLATLAATGLPIYISELDVNFANDDRHAVRMSELFSMFWGNPSVVGVTHWGYRQGSMWQTDAYLLHTDGTPRPALTFIACYRAGGTSCYVPTYTPEPRKGDTSGIKLEAEDYDSAHGLLPAGTMVAYASDGAWLGYDKVAMNDNWNTLSVAYAQGGGNAISLSIHLGSLANPPVATVPLAPTGDWTTMKTVSIPWAPLAGEQNLFVRFNGGGANLDKLQFGAPAGTGKNLIVDSDFELATPVSWWSWSSGTIANTTARAVSGTHALAMTGRTGGGPLVQTLTNTVLPGKTYKASLWGTIGGAASASAQVTTAIQCGSEPTSYGRLGGWGNVKTIADGTWVELAGDLVIPDCALTQVLLYLEGPGANIDMYIDHVSVRQVTTSNIIANGTFESGTTGWYTWTGATATATTARFHGGGKSLLVSPRAGNLPPVTDLTSVVKAGTNYPFSLWVSIDSPDGSSASINVTQAATCKAADGTSKTTYDWIGGPVSVPDTTGFIPIAGTVRAPNCTLTSLVFWVEGGVGSDLYVDDVEILDVSGPAPNLIPDGTFEAGQGAWGGWNNTSLAVADGYAHGGSKSLVSAGRTQNGTMVRDVTSLVTAGKRYQVSFWVSVKNMAAGSAAVNTTRMIDCGSASYNWLAQKPVNNGEWQEVSGTLDLSACSTINQVLIYAEGPTSGDLYVDDVTMTLVP